MKIVLKFYIMIFPLASKTLYAKKDNVLKLLHLRCCLREIFNHFAGYGRWFDTDRELDTVEKYCKICAKIIIVLLKDFIASFSIILIDKF